MKFSFSGCFLKFFKIEKFHDISMTGKAFIFPGVSGVPGGVGTLIDKHENKKH